MGITGGNGPNAILFGKVGNKEYNLYHGSSANPLVYTGIVKNALNGGKIDFNSGINSIDLFSTSNSNYNSYSDVSFPFTYSNGYYTYDSKDNSATLNGSKIDIGSTGNGGFWPFGKTSTSGTQMGDFYFGMSMEVEFYVPENRTVDGTANGDDLVFNFTGDDDVWIFVDGRLALDLGGIHNAAGGSINFTTGDITNPGRYTGTAAPDTTLATDFGNDFKTNAFKASSVHTLKVFYLERGAGESNLKMSFNIPPVEPLSVEKEVSKDGNFGKDSFDFTIETKNSEGASFSAYGNKAYEVQTTGGAVLRTGLTDANGKFSIADGEKAIFRDFDDDDWFRLEEINNDGIYSNAWTLPDNDDSHREDDSVVGQF